MADGLKVYEATVWIKGTNGPGERTTVVAKDGDDARRQLREKYGQDIIVSLWNQEDAKKLR